MSGLTTPANELAIWHDVECGSYHADLDVWKQLAARYGGPILELGAGTGRVALALARDGHEVTAVDHAPALLAVLAERARGAGLGIEAVNADARGLGLGARFGLVIAPMQLLQVLGNSAQREEALRSMRRHLATGGAAAAAIVEPTQESAPPAAASEALPDVREVDGWVYSSLPVAVSADRVAIEARRLRQRVSPDGRLEDHEHVDRLLSLDAGELDREAAGVGLASAGRRQIPSDEAFVGSTVCVWEVAP